VKRTPLYEAHLALGARMVEFGGWEMPVWYEGIPAEHLAVRNFAGLFDVSHMGQFVVYDRDATAFLQRVLTNDVAELEPGQAQYTLLPNAAGGTVDDLLAYRLPDGKRGHPVYLLVVNAGNIEKDWEHLAAQRRPEERVGMDDHSEAKGLVALQGPRAPMILSELTRMPVFHMPYYGFERGEVAGIQAMVSRTGYTGEDGFEIMAEADEIVGLWDAILEVGAAHEIRPCGLGARDSLRLEASMPLYGHELDDETSAVEAGLGYFLELSKPEQLGGERLRREKVAGRTRKLVCFEMTERGIPRQGYPILIGGEAVGAVTSGVQSPSSGKAIGMGYVPNDAAKIGDAIGIEMRGRVVAAEIVRRPFYKRAP
jgi:aminomethyltransferase